MARHSSLSAALFIGGVILTIHLWWRLRGSTKRLGWGLSLGLLLCAHPVWWLSAVGGDCGYLLFHASLMMSALQAAVIGSGHRWLRRARS